MTGLDHHRFPPGGWVFLQPQTGWRAPTPLNSTFDQTVDLIIKHRRGNPAITSKHSLTLDRASVADELDAFNRARLGIPTENAPPKSRPLRQVAGSVGAVAEASADRSTIAFGIKRAAQGTAVVLDWLTSGGAPVAKELAWKRAEICASCDFNKPGSWYTVAPASIIKSTLDLRSDIKLDTPWDEKLLSCNVCRCLNRLKVWCPMDHILARTKPEVLREFPPHCWIAKKDQ